MSKITINHININGTKTLDIISDICAICQENILDKCNECNTNNNTCYSVVGTCKHAYHYCCINSWTNNQSNNQKCPMCNQKWELKKRAKH